MSSVMFLPQVFQSHRSTGFPQIPFDTRAVTAIPKLSLSSPRTLKHMGAFPSFPHVSATIIVEPLLIPIFQSEVVEFLFLDAHRGSTRIHKAGLSPFSHRYLCQSSENSFHTFAVLIPSWRFACKHPVAPSSPSRRPIRLRGTECFPSVA